MKPPIIHNVRIAVAEKDESTRTLLEHVLMYCVNRDITTFSTCQQAWDALTAGEMFDIIIASVESKGMSGLEFLENKGSRP